MGCSVDFLLVVHPGLGEIIYNHNPSVWHSRYSDKKSHQKMIKKYSNMSYNTVKVELECFQIHSFRSHLIVNNVTNVAVKSFFFLIISRLLNLKYYRITIYWTFGQRKHQKHAFKLTYFLMIVYGGIHCWISMRGQMPRIIALIYFIHHIHTLFLSKFGDWDRFVTGSNIELSVKLREILYKMLLQKPCFLLNEMLSWKTVSGVCESHSKE